MKMIQHCIKLNEEEQHNFERVKKELGFGATKIFKAMLKSLAKTLPEQIED